MFILYHDSLISRALDRYLRNFVVWTLLLEFSNNFNVSNSMSLHNLDLSMSNSLNNSSLSTYIIRLSE